MNNMHAPLLPMTVCLMLGIVIAHNCQSSFPWPLLLGAAVAGGWCCMRWPRVQTVTIGLCFFLLGLTVGQMSRDEAVEEDMMECVVMSEPAEKPKTIAVDVVWPRGGGRQLRCYLWKDERSRRLQVGDALVLHHHRSTFVRSKDWHPGGGGRQQLSRLLRLKLRFLQWRHVVLERYRSLHADDEVYGILAAMTLGDKTALTPSVRETFSVTGASHVLALSGLHLGIIYALIAWLPFGFRYRWLHTVLSVLFVWGFVLLTGLSTSVVRAATMITVYAVFAVRHQSKASANVLCFAALVMLLVDARMLFDVGFQLSFASVFSILLFMPLLGLGRDRWPWPLRWLWNMGALSLSAQLGVAPLIAFYFGRFSTWFLITNLVVVPAAFIILWGTIVILLIPAAADVLLWVVKLMNGVLQMIAALPCSSIENLHPTVLQVALTYVFIGIVYVLLRYRATYKIQSETIG